MASFCVLVNVFGAAPPMLPAFRTETAVLQGPEIQQCCCCSPYHHGLLEMGEFNCEQLAD
jgi:hypothetical protein